MLFHGTRHRIKRDSILFKLGIIPTLEVMKNIKTIDVDPRTLPTVVADLEVPLLDEVITQLGNFDIITSEYPPFVVYQSRTFFQNVVKLLKPGGMFAMWPGLLTHSKYPLSPTKWIIPLNPYRDMRARTRFARNISMANPSLELLKKINKLLVFQKCLEP